MTKPQYELLETNLSQTRRAVERSEKQLEEIRKEIRRLTGTVLKLVKKRHTLSTLREPFE